MTPVQGPAWDADFAAATRFARQQARKATAEQRLAWLESTLEIARASGAWQRERDRRDREEADRQAK
jgi:hypothetical protein